MSQQNDTKFHDLPIGIAAAGIRIESDSMGEIAVPAEHYWGAQTARALVHFAIGTERLPPALYHAYGIVKRAAAEVNASGGHLPEYKAHAIIHAAGEVASGALDDEFPLSMWQTGSGTQANMNVNEVIANRAIQLLGGRIGSKSPVHPNDDVNKAQSSNDSFPTAMHVATALAIQRQVRPAVVTLADTIEHKSSEWMDVVKIGRTHLMDAVPLTVGQEWSGWAAQLRSALAALDRNCTALFELAAGGTAVGTGTNAPSGFSRAIAARISELTGLPFRSAPNKFASLGGLDASAATMAGLRGIAIALIKIANDLRWLGSGPRCGIGEVRLPENEPGSSIMPGKINPSIAEAFNMICHSVLGSQQAVNFSSMAGQLELNVMMPNIDLELTRSIDILTNGIKMFREKLIDGLEADTESSREHMSRSFGSAALLNPVLGYDTVARIVQEAMHTGKSIKSLALATGKIKEEEFDRLMSSGIPK